MTAVDAPACYVFGVVDADARLPAGDDGDSFADLRLVPAGGADDIAALVATPPLDRPLGRAADLVAHDRVLGRLVAAGTAVLPVRFGSVLAGEDAVAEELLRPHRDRFRDALDRLRGRVQYTVTARYDQDAVLREVVADVPEVARLRASQRDGADASVTQRMRLGELVVAALAERRPDDAAALLAAIEAEAEQVRTQEPTAPDEVLHAACLVPQDRCTAFEQSIEELGRRHHRRLRLRLVGPVPGYDFVEEQ